ncbi:MAG: hypothetical protein H7A48_03915 [Akkermansiaceae bacterium]|nr:hypothetical protein [Akkermansiaceae bacterium]
MKSNSNETNRRGSGASSILVSLTDFVDFVSKSGRPKLTQVQTVKWRPKYDPQTDFWRPLRETIIDFHKTNQSQKSQLDAAMVGITHKPKLAAYPQALAGYKKFLGKKQFQSLPETRSSWSHGNLHVGVNPELSVSIQGVPQLLKLYFKAEPLSKKHAELILLMMADSLGPQAAPGTVMGLLDVQRGKLFTATHVDQALKPLLQGEASSFETMWNQLPAHRPRRTVKTDAA